MASGPPIADKTKASRIRLGRLVFPEDADQRHDGVRIADRHQLRLRLPPPIVRAVDDRLPQELDPPQPGDCDAVVWAASSRLDFSSAVIQRPLYFTNPWAALRSSRVSQVPSR